MPPALLLESVWMVARSRALAAASRDALGRSRERIERTAQIIMRTHSLPDFELSVREMDPLRQAALIEASVRRAQQREIDREMRGPPAK